MEGSTVLTKYGMVKTDHILFIASGAFHGSKPSDLLPELQGRFPIRVELNSLTQEDFVRILTEPQNALIIQYEALLSTEGITLRFVESAIAQIAKMAYQANETMENIGARRWCPDLWGSASALLIGHETKKDIPMLLKCSIFKLLP